MHAVVTSYLLGDKRIRGFRYSRSEFMEKVFYAAVQAGAAVVAFNLPFDLSRLAVEYRVARDAGGRGWSFVLFQYYDHKKRRWLPNSFRPRIKLRPKDSKAAFIRLAGGDMHQPYRLGRFIDLKTLVWALRNKSLKLDTACQMFGVPGKMDHAPTGKVIPAEISYCREDVRATTDLLNALRAEFDGYPVDLVPEKAYSAASIAKACLRTMGMTSPLEKFQLDDSLLGICMQAYYGGRAECRIRHTPVPVVYTDFTSQYPTVNTLLKLWPLLIAEKLRVRDVTVEVRQFLAGLTLDQLLEQSQWPKFAFFALVQPDRDILPVRTVYGDTRAGDQTNIGLNPLTSAKPIWFAGPDLVASLLLTGRVPKILRAIRFEPEGVEKGMRPIQLGTSMIDPYRDDFFRKVIELRKGKAKTDPLYYFLKILANAGCYGIYAEVNRLTTGKNNRKEIALFSGEESRTLSTSTVESPGPWYFPPVSALITAGGRLLLAILEKMVTDAGGTYLMVDTDSMAIVASERGGLVPCKGGPHRLGDGREAIQALPWAMVRQIIARFEALNPYDRSIIKGSVLNIVEDINNDAAGAPRQVYGYGISAKRYALYIHANSGIRIIKASEHGLGLYYRPKEGRDKECDVALWIREGWHWIVSRALGLPCTAPEWFSTPAMRRISISTPNVMVALRRLDRNRARPYNFAISPVLVNLSGVERTLLAPFESNPALWWKMPYIDIHDGSVHYLDRPTEPLLTQTFDIIFAQYGRHAEAKSLAPDGGQCTATSDGLLQRYPITASAFHFIGKETERGWEQPEDISTLLPSLVHYGADRTTSKRLSQFVLQVPSAALARETGLSRHTILRVRRGKTVHPGSLKILNMALLRRPGASHTSSQAISGTTGKNCRRNAGENARP